MSHSNEQGCFLLLKPLQVRAGWCRPAQPVLGRSSSPWAPRPTAALPPPAAIWAHGRARHQVGDPLSHYMCLGLCCSSHSRLHTEYVKYYSYPPGQWAPTVPPARCAPPAAGSMSAPLLAWPLARPLQEGSLAATPYPGTRERPAACATSPTGRLLPAWRDSLLSRPRNSPRRHSWR